MSRLLSLNNIDDDLKALITKKLRDCDEAIVLPQAHRSPESGIIKNVIMKLDGSVSGINPDVFSPMWFSGVSVIKFPTDKAEQIIQSDEIIKSTLQKLKGCIPSEMHNSSVQVGPELNGDEFDRDTLGWEAGFDSPVCCVGLYSSLQNRCDNGISRSFKSFYLVCKAGPGICGQTFHARLVASLKQGASLNDALSENGNPGSRALRRVSYAAKRNRGRILKMAADILGFDDVDTIYDNASPADHPYRIAIPEIDICYNAIVRNDYTDTWRYTSGCTEKSLSVGTLVSSNMTEGFIAFTKPSGDMRFELTNEACDSLPFSSKRIISNRDAVMKAVKHYKKNTDSTRDGKSAHTDCEWISTHFSWNSKPFKQISPNKDIEPPGFWGTHQSEEFISEWLRELGIAGSSVVRLIPECVAISAVEGGKLRIALKEIYPESQ
jgi:hypothetical protein